MSTEMLYEPDMRELIERLVDEKVEARLRDIEARLAQSERAQVGDRATIMVFSGEFDKLMCAFIIAAGARAMGLDVTMYFTFWGLVALKKKTIYSGKTTPEKMVSMLIPGGPGTVPTSSLNMLGVGPAFFKHLMKESNVETLPDLITLSQELGVKMIACQMSMGVMGIKEEELIDDLVYGGAGTYLGDASDSRMTLFI